MTWTDAALWLALWILGGLLFWSWWKRNVWRG